MKSWFDLLPRARGGAPPAPGVYPFTLDRGGALWRLHLRVDPDGAGMLVSNGAEAAYLSPVGVLMADRILKGLPDAAVKAEVRAAFSGGAEGAISDDLWQVHRLIGDLTSPGARFPITSLKGADKSGLARRLSAPFRACLEQCAPETGEALLRKLWDAGVAHVTLLTDPARESGELVRLVECAQDLGMIAGLRGLASWWPGEVLSGAALAGLDYLTTVLAAAATGEHDALTVQGDFARVGEVWDWCHDQELCAVAQIPLTDTSMYALDDTLALAAGRSVVNCAVFAVACVEEGGAEDRDGAVPARALPQAATLVSEGAEALGLTVSWEPPVWFDAAQGLATAVQRGPRAGGEVSVRVTAEGAVLPARGGRVCAGNLLTQPWADIWGGPCFTRYREGVGPPARCEACPDVGFCDEGCLKDPTTWSDDRAEGEAR
jgi:hypothetical protein